MGSCKCLRRMIFWCLYLLLTQLVVSVSVLGQAPSSEGFINIDCGLTSNAGYVHSATGLTYVSDDQYIDTGVNKNVSSQYSNECICNLDLNTLRSFPNGTKNCYTLTGVSIGSKYLVRAQFYHGDYNGLPNFPKFDLYFGVNFWDTVTISGYVDWYPYEIIAVASTNYIQVCLVNTGFGTPFINTLELRPLSSTMYQHANSTHSLNLYARADLGSNNTYDRYPSDAYDRMWLDHMFSNNNKYPYPSWVNYVHLLPNISTSTTIQDSSFGVPSWVLQTATLSSAPNSSIDLAWSTSNISTTFGLILHFAEIQIFGRNSLREFDVYVNGAHEYRYSNTSFLATSSSSLTMTGYQYYNVSLKSTPKATLPPMLNAFEQYTILPVILFPTYHGDVTAINSIKASYSVRKDWNGDPCVPTSFGWTGVNCTTNSSNIPRITALNLSSNRLTGEFISAFGNLTALETLDLSHNNLMGLIPSSLDQLISLIFLDLSENNGLLHTLPPGLLQKLNNGHLIVKFNDTASVPDTKKSSKAVMLVIVAVVITLLIVGAVLFFLCLKKQTNNRVNAHTSNVRNGHETGVFRLPFHSRTKQSYVSTAQLNRKSDVYSFGVILLEIVTGKSPILQDPQGGDGRYLSQFVRQPLSEGNIGSILDANMAGPYNLNSISKVAHLALRCTDCDEPANRPDMTGVVAELKEIMALEMSTSTETNNSASGDTIFLSCE